MWELADNTAIGKRTSSTLGLATNWWFDWSPAVGAGSAAPFRTGIDDADSDVPLREMESSGVVAGSSAIGGGASLDWPNSRVAAGMIAPIEFECLSSGLITFAADTIARASLATCCRNLSTAASDLEERSSWSEQKSEAISEERRQVWLTLQLVTTSRTEATSSGVGSERNTLGFWITSTTGWETSRACWSSFGHSRSNTILSNSFTPRAACFSKSVGDLVDSDVAILVRTCRSSVKT